MALIQMNMFSKTLMRQVMVHVILPMDKLADVDKPEREEKPYKTLYLLHGMYGNYMDWVSGTRIQRFAEEHELAVVMPSGDNAFYVDQSKTNNFYGEFVGKELVELTRRMFPLSRKREDTFIGGLSMGGYGAMRNGLKYHNTFGNIISLSGAFIIDELPRRTNEPAKFCERREYAESCFGDLDKLAESDMNPQFLVEKLLKEGAEVPKLYIACGDKDSLLKGNQDFVDFLQKKGVENTFVVAPGDHEWDFWDTYIKKAIEWLPTEDKKKICVI